MTVSKSAATVRVGVVKPMPGVAYALQGRGGELEASLAADEHVLWFETTLRCGSPLVDERANFSGSFAHGPPADRFVYVNSGQRAGQAKSCWDRRAKVKLSAIPTELVTHATRSADCYLQARFAGTSRDGGPFCGTVQPLDSGWDLVREAGSHLRDGGRQR